MSDRLYTPEELKGMSEILDGISTHIPTEYASFIWENYKKITKSTEPQPCNCGSSAQLWRKAVETIKNYLKEGK